MNKFSEFHFASIYEFTDIIDNSVKAEVDFWNFDEDYFIQSVTKFSKETLLHLYIVTTMFNYHRRYFRRDGDMIDDEVIEKWYSLFSIYNVDIKPFDFDAGDDIFEWFEANADQFINLFDTMSYEIFYILFGNRAFLLRFNDLIINTLIEINIPKEFLTDAGTIKRVLIPQWLKKAVFHRDKGRCVYCQTDLTNLVNTLTTINYDHMIPLDLNGCNDPCNIQLTCERCNKKKGHRKKSTGSRYIPWWI